MALQRRGTETPRCLGITAPARPRACTPPRGPAPPWPRALTFPRLNASAHSHLWPYTPSRLYSLAFLHLCNITISQYCCYALCNVIALASPCPWVSMLLSLAFSQLCVFVSLCLCASALTPLYALGPLCFFQVRLSRFFFHGSSFLYIWDNPSLTCSHFYYSMTLYFRALSCYPPRYIVNIDLVPVLKF